VKDTRDSSECTVEVTMSGNAIASAIKDNLLRQNFTLPSLVGQGYDGASAMASDRVGVAANIKAVAPLADYFHCAMHALNLSCSRAVSVVEIRHAQDVIKDLTRFFDSAKRTDHLTSIVKLQAPPHTKSHLVKLCTTRFVERYCCDNSMGLVGIHCGTTFLLSLKRRSSRLS